MAALALALVGPAIPALAQDTMGEARLRKMEAEIRALQRKVFPGADGKFFAPEIAQQDAAQPATGQPATTAVTDILTRLDSIEAQIARLTGQAEQNSNRIAQLEARAGITTATEGAPAAAAVPAATSTSTSTGTATATAVTPPAATPASPSVAQPPATTPASAPAPTPAAQSNLNAMTGGASAAKPAQTVKAAVKTALKGPSAQRLAAVQTIVKPQTNDPGDDEYSYGFRLWEAKFYPEAQQQLKLFVEKYPRHSRISYGRNLLGRAYLDDGNPGEAAKWFLQNYQADKQGARAADSLLYLGIAMKQMKDTKRACIALAEFSETYAVEASGRLKSEYGSTRNGIKCS